MFAASLSFLTPMGYQTNTMIYTPGNYKFSDYTKIGIPLSIILCIVAMIVIPIYFPFAKVK
jgi:di/tricarboxylate transporter